MGNGDSKGKMAVSDRPANRIDSPLELALDALHLADEAREQFQQTDGLAELVEAVRKLARALSLQEIRRETRPDLFSESPHAATCPECGTDPSRTPTPTCWGCAMYADLVGGLIS